jgi:transposase
MAKHRTFSEEFKHEAVRLVDGGQSVSQVARDLGIGLSTLWAWHARYGTKTQAEPPPPDSVPELKKEIARLRKQVLVLGEEKQILKKATAFFARENR